MASPRSIRTALISVYDKTGVVEFARALQSDFDIDIISTGGTARALRDAGIAVRLVEDISGFGEMLDGRVKTLHPSVHAAILADRDNPAHMRQLRDAGITPIDLVAVNLYPFEKTVADANCTPEQGLEMIDIGGVALMRAAAKNHRSVVVLASPQAYSESLAHMMPGGFWRGGADDDFRLRLAETAMFATSAYDAQIARWLGARLAGARGNWPPIETIYARRCGSLRYGENPHQQAYLLQPVGAEAGADLTQADSAWRDSQPAMSYNNYLDADAALGLCRELTHADQLAASGAAAPASPKAPAAPAAVLRASIRACCFIKHGNACGVGVSSPTDDTPPAGSAAQLEAYRRAYLGDPNAAMGGVLACNFPIDAEFAQTVMETYDRFGRPLKQAGAPFAPGGFFVEAWIAPAFTADAVALIRGRDDRSLSPTQESPPDPRPKKKWGEGVRLLAVPDLCGAQNFAESCYRTIAGGILAQAPDRPGLNEEAWICVTRRGVSAAELAGLRLAWLICKHTRSNAITLVCDGALIGNGAGQMSRVMSCRIATWLARENGHLGAAQQRAEPSVAASDAFFPFPDGPRILIDAGVTAIIQPGGSKRDNDTIKLCDEHNVAMIMTATRHFRH